MSKHRRLYLEYYWTFLGKLCDISTMTAMQYIEWFYFYLQKKCIQYWPEEDILNVEPFTVVLQSSDKFADFTIRNLKLTKVDVEIFMYREFYHDKMCYIYVYDV